MNRPLNRVVALLLTAILTLTGCHPTQPFYLHEDGDLSHYLDTMTAIENPDLQETMLTEVTQTHAPLTLSDLEFTKFRDLSLEECASIALHNSKIVRNLGSLTQFTIADGLVGRTAGSLTVYDPAIFETDPQFGVEAALSTFDAQFTTSAFWEKTDRPQNFGGFTQQAIFSNFLRRDSGQFNAELNKRTATGTTFAVRNQTLYDGNNNQSSGLPSVWTTVFEAEATQPLLRGRGAQVNRAPILRARMRTDQSLADLESAVRNMLMDMENTYWDLQNAYRVLETAKIGRDSALVTWKNTYVLLQGGKGTAQQEAQAREQYFFFRAQMESALRDLLAAEGRLRWLMGLTPTDGELLRPVDRPTMARVEFEWASAHTEALVRSPELRRERWVVKQRELELIEARNRLLPQLDLVATYRWLGMGDQLITAGRRGTNFINADPNNASLPINPGATVPVGAPTPGSTAFDELTEGRFQEFRLGLQFTPPKVGARQEMAGVRNAQLQLAREKARLKDMELNVSHTLTSAIQTLDFQYHAAQSHFNRWAAAEKEVEALKALYEGGQANVDLVLDGQRRRAQAQADFYRAVAEYNKSIANVHFRKGTLLAYDNIKLAEGPWPQKAYWDALGQARKRDASYYLDYGWTRPSVVSRGPVDQEAVSGMLDDQAMSSQPTSGSGAEEILTPPPIPNVPPDNMPAPMPLDALPDSPPPPDALRSSMLDGPSLSLRDNAPPELMEQPAPKRFAWGNLGLSTPSPVRQAGHEEPVGTGVIQGKRN